MKLKIKFVSNIPEMKCPNCSKWIKLEVREVESVPVSVECECGKKWGIFTYKGE